MEWFSFWTPFKNRKKLTSFGKNKTASKTIWKRHFCPVFKWLNHSQTDFPKVHIFRFFEFWMVVGLRIPSVLGSLFYVWSWYHLKHLWLRSVKVSCWIALLWNQNQKTLDDSAVFVLIFVEYTTHANDVLTYGGPEFHNVNTTVWAGIPNMYGIQMVGNCSVFQWHSVFQWLTKWPPFFSVFQWSPPLKKQNFWLAWTIFNIKKLYFVNRQNGLD